MVPKSWGTCTLGELTQKGRGICYGVVKPGELDECGVALIRGGDVQDGRIASDLRTISAEVSLQYKRTLLQGGELIVCLVGYPGETAIVPTKLKGANLARQVGLIALKASVDRDFVHQFLRSPIGRKRLLAPTIGSAQKVINIAELKKVAIPIPPIDEQRRIANVLLCWDRAIELTELLVEEKLTRKHAVMHQLIARANAECSEAKLGELFKNRKEKGSKGLPTYSVTMDSGLVLRDPLDRKNDTTLEPEQHLLIEEGDIAYNMMRMWQGASGLATEAGLVSPAYVVIRSRGKVDPAFASYWFKMPRVVKKFQDYSHGLTKDRLRLYYKDFATISLPLPPLELQQQIAKAMQCCDRELDALERKVVLLKQQKKGLMQQLLTGKTRVKLPKGAA